MKATSSQSVEMMVRDRASACRSIHFACSGSRIGARNGSGSYCERPASSSLWRSVHAARRPRWSSASGFASPARHGGDCHGFRFNARHWQPKTRVSAFVGSLFRIARQKAVSNRRVPLSAIATAQLRRMPSLLSGAFLDARDRCATGVWGGGTVVTQAVPPMSGMLGGRRCITNGTCQIGRPARKSAAGRRRGRREHSEST